MQINSTNLTKNRIVWIDWTKAILIFLVILGHSGSVFTPILYLFHIPAFFFVSGYLCNYNKKSTGTINSSRWMIYSIILYNLVFIALNTFVAITTGKGLFHAERGTSLYELMLRPVIGITWCYYKSADFSNPLLAQFWFVWVLIILRWSYQYISTQS